ncbi:MAG: ABC transporter permease subunit [Anaerolineae bacterium]|nr:ABC transporter permease subunit [Anaerolineae bacterium]
MRNVWIIARRELYAYFASPIAYLVAAAFIFLCGIFFVGGVTQWRDASMQPVHGSLSVVLIFVAPILTMRLLSREQDLGTIELLLTAPVRSWEVVGGKFLASLLFYLGMILVTGLYVVILVVYGTPDMGTIGASTVGVVLLGAAMLALGVFTSALTKNQVVAAVLGVVASVSLWLLDILSALFGGTAQKVISYLTPSGHYDSFIDGIIDTRDLVYYASFCFVLLFLASQVIESKRWQA